MEETQVLSIPIEDIKIDVSMDPRLGEDRDHDVIEGYSQNIDDLPPIVIDQDNHIIDGVHRYQAHQLAGEDTIRVKRQVMQDEGEAFITSVKANAIHGESLKPMHLQKAARRLYSQYGFSNDEISPAVKRGESTISNWLRDLKQEWKAHVRESAYRLYEGTDEYVDKATSKAIRKREWTQERIAEHLSGPREKAIGTRTLRNHIEHRRDELKAKKDALEEAERLAEEARLEAQLEREARAAEEQAQAEQSDEGAADVAADEAAAPPEDTDTADIATDADVEPLHASESYEESPDSEDDESPPGTTDPFSDMPDREITEDLPYYSDLENDDQPDTAEEPAPEPEDTEGEEDEEDDESEPNPFANVATRVAPFAPATEAAPSVDTADTDGADTDDDHDSEADDDELSVEDRIYELFDGDVLQAPLDGNGGLDFESLRSIQGMSMADMTAFGIGLDNKLYIYMGDDDPYKFAGQAFLWQHAWVRIS